MNTDQLITALLVAAVDMNSQIPIAKSRDAVTYLLGGRETLRALAEALQQSCPLAVELFQAPTTVTKDP